MDRHLEWAKAVDNAYDVFSLYHPPKSLDGTPKHDTAQILKRLTAVPLRMLTVEALGVFAGSALTTLGDVDDYKHFLPRILELSITETGWQGFDPPIIAHKLNYAGFPDWPSAEQGAVKSVFAAAWRALRDERSEAEVQLCACAIIGMGLEPLLDGWKPAADEEGVQLWHELDRASERCAYWKWAPEAAHEAITKWLQC